MIPIFQKFLAGRQIVITLCHYLGQVQVGIPIAFESPCEGYAWITGMVYSDQNLQVDVDQGINDQGGALTYRHNRNFVVAAGTAEARRYDIHGKFARVTLTNLAGVAANVEAYFVCRGGE